MSLILEKRKKIKKNKENKFKFFLKLNYSLSYSKSIIAILFNVSDPGKKKKNKEK